MYPHANRRYSFEKVGSEATLVIAIPRKLGFMLFLSGLALPALAGPSSQPTRGDTYSAAATSGCFMGEEQNASLQIVSPDGKAAIQKSGLTHGGTAYYLKLDGKSKLIYTAAWPCPEFDWAPDSQAFFVNYSDGGNVGNWSTTVVRTEKGEVEDIDVSKDAVTDFDSHYPKCYTHEEPNVGAVTWLKDSSRLLIAVEVFPDSNCDDMGTFSAYEVTVPGGKIIRKYNQIEAKRLFWKQLGRELRNADDDCIRKPGSCDIPDLHHNDSGD